MTNVKLYDRNKIITAELTYYYVCYNDDNNDFVSKSFTNEDVAWSYYNAIAPTMTSWHNGLTIGTDYCLVSIDK